MRRARRPGVATLLAVIVWTVLSTMAQAAGVALIGDQTIYSSADSNAAGHAEAFRATAGASGTVISLSVYIDPSSRGTSLVAGLYTDNGGTPGSLLAQGQLTRPAAGW